MTKKYRRIIEIKQGDNLLKHNIHNWSWSSWRELDRWLVSYSDTLNNASLEYFKNQKEHKKYCKDTDSDFNKAPKYPCYYVCDKNGELFLTKTEYKRWLRDEHCSHRATCFIEV